MAVGSLLLQLYFPLVFYQLRIKNKQGSLKFKINYEAFYLCCIVTKRRYKILEVWVLLHSKVIQEQGTKHPL